MPGRFCVIGVGRFGTAIAKELTAKGAEVIAIDADRERIERISDTVTYAVSLDSTNKEALLSQGINLVDAVVVSIGEDFQDVLLTTFALQELKVKRIIVRAHGEVQNKILEKMGVKEILSPEGEVSHVVAENLINPTVLFSLKFPDDYAVIEVKAPKGIVKRSLAEIGLREKYKLNMVTLLSANDKKNLDIYEENSSHQNHHIIGVPEGETIINANDILLLFGKNKDIKRFIEING